MKGEGASLAERPDALIVATPGQAKLQAIVLIQYAQPMSHRREAVGDGQGVLSLVGEIEDGRAEDRPIAAEQDTAGKAQLFLVAQILDRGIDIAVEAEVANLDVGLIRADREVEL